jgi:hypothetical protein
MSEQPLSTLAELAEQPLAEERRARVRFAASQELTTHILTAEWNDGWSRAAVLDVSTSGIGFLCPVPFPVGASLEVEMRSPYSAFWRTWEIRVAHCTPVDGGQWQIGGTFPRELSEAELRASLA